MTRRLLTRASLALALGGWLGGCITPAPRAPFHIPAAQLPKKDYYATLPAGEHALRKITDPSQLPPLSAGLAYRQGLKESVARSLHYLAKPSSKGFFPISGIEHRQVVASLEVFAELLDRDLSDLELAAELRRRFDVYTTVGCDGEGTVLFTGYYTPIFEASRTRTGEFQHPLHRLPVGHEKDPISGKTLGLRQPDGSLQTDYPTRDELLAGHLLDGRELVYLRDPFEAYVIGVQGSAILRLRDGSFLEVGYAGNNGHEYASLGAALVAAGKMKKEELNLRNMIAYFQAHPEEFAPLAANNERYVFFQEGAGGPFGCLNEKVEAMRTIATDKEIFPRGALCFLEASLPLEVAKDGQGVYHGFALDQDAGGAIRAPGRCDVYMGVGEEAGELAGHTWAEGRLYYLILKDGEELARR